MDKYIDIDSEAKDHEKLRKEKPLVYIQLYLLYKYSYVEFNNGDIIIGTIDNDTFLNDSDDFIIYTLSGVKKDYKLKRLAISKKDNIWAPRFEKVCQKSMVKYARITTDQERKEYDELLENVKNKNYN